jgi:hypothetical protein
MGAFIMLNQAIAEWKEKKFGRLLPKRNCQRCTGMAVLYYNPGDYIQPEIIDRCMDGAIELHTHGAPTAWLAGRSNYYDTAVACSEAKMKAIVFKDQDTQTCAMAGVVQRSLEALAEEKAKQGIEFKPMQVFGGLVLDKTVGGMNLHAVRKTLSFGRCKLIWLHCWDSAHMQEVMGDETRASGSQL